MPVACKTWRVFMYSRTLGACMQGSILTAKPSRHLATSLNTFATASEAPRKSGASKERFLESRVALVTGSTSGIGLGAARALAARGCHIVLHGFADEQLIKSLQTEFKEVYKVTTSYMNANLVSQSETNTLFKTVKSLHPNGIDILINNAGFQHVSKVDEFPLDKWNEIGAVLLTAPFQLIQLALPDMVRRGWGRIINLASVHSVKASPFKAAYVSAKHGIAGLTKVVALETAGSGVTCNAVSPGYVDTPILKFQVQALADKEGLSYEKAERKFLEHFHPSKEAVAIDEIGELMVYLTTDAARQITGTNILIDGGWGAK